MGDGAPRDSTSSGAGLLYVEGVVEGDGTWWGERVQSSVGGAGIDKGGCGGRYSVMGSCRVWEGVK